MAPWLKLENLQLDIWALAFRDRMAEVWSVAFPMKSHPMKL